MIKNLFHWLFSVWTAVFLALLYGIVAFFAFRYPAWKDLFGLMTVAYLFLVPLVLGCMTVFFGEWRARRSWWFRIFMPWAPVGLLALLSLVFAWEGAICVLMVLPSFLIMASLGGVLYGLTRDLRGTRLNAVLVGSVLVLPFLGAPLEHRLDTPSDYREVATSIEIVAAADEVWPEIVEVRSFRPEEHRFAWVHAIGFPRPVAATLSRPGVGGVRRATFEGGVTFFETVDRWEPGRALAFSIASDPDSIPQTTLDEHVTVGGPFFDVLRGSYEIEPLAPGRVRLRLVSRYRLTTPFNFYSSVWTDFVMRDVQNYILAIIRLRAESTTLRSSTQATTWTVFALRTGCRRGAASTFAWRE